MKKMISVVLIVLMIIGVFSGCAPKTNTLRVLVDMEYQVVQTDYALSRAVADFEGAVERAGIEDVEFEFLPKEGVERETAVDRLRTEIMSGKGPDVFLIRCDGTLANYYTGTAIFQIPEKAMESGLFLPLDEYIENAQHAEWDRFLPQIMEAGKTEEGQVFIPLSYTTRAALYRKSDFEHTPSKEMSWQDMPQDAELHDTAAVLGDGAELDINGLDGSIGIIFHTDFILGDLADYKNEELMFTEEELLQRVNECVALYDYTLTEKLFEKPDWAERYLGKEFNANNCFIRGVANGLTSQDTLTMVPLYSDDGGTTAQIMAYAAVNRNTRRPEDAFAIIDLLLRTKYQQSSLMFDFWIFGPSQMGASIHDGLMSKEYKLDPPGSRQTPETGWWMTEENFSAFCDVRDSITNVQYYGALNGVLHDMMLECYIAVSEGEDYTEIVSRTYNTMKQMVSE